ncbi:hypothetical protein SCLCIDRAFT_1216391 [Scleroderma citrinum Foug A]|uniref:Uncharacterized protein n=1 Tax=Scleroderma citrinum Foug A TaxID=1036808 RepID=A0A0C3DXH1_9AGAM|nr:hypothetical protein SCLCIDRAFT_1216391 [Scleroderma citrinum Foug A]
MRWKSAGTIRIPRFPPSELFSTCLPTSNGTITLLYQLPPSFLDCSKNKLIGTRDFLFKHNQVQISGGREDWQSRSS